MKNIQTCVLMPPPLPPFEEEGSYCFANVGLSVVQLQIKWFPIVVLKTIYHRAFIFHILIGLGKDKTRTDFGFTNSRTHGSLLLKKWFPFIFLRTIYHRAFISHMLIGLGEYITCIDFGFTRSKVKFTRVLFVKQWFLSLS